MSRRLERSATDRVISGVCGGIAEYLAIDPTLVRVFFVLAGIFTGGLFVIAYVALMFVMPLPGRPVTGIAASAGSTASEVADSLRRAADDITQSFRREPNTATGTQFFRSAPAREAAIAGANPPTANPNCVPTATPDMRTLVSNCSFQRANADPAYPL